MSSIPPNTIQTSGRRGFRRTRIIFTVGPATSSPEMLRNLIREGVDVCRINMAHASPEWTREIIARVRLACREAGRVIALMMDVKGPEIRTGALDQPIDLQAGDLIDLTVDKSLRLPAPGVPPAVPVNYPLLTEDVALGDTILVDSGLLRLTVTAKTSTYLQCRVEIGGRLGSRRHINLPGVRVRLPSITAKDHADIDLGIAEGIDFFALSFVREPDDLDVLRRHLTDRGSTARIIAKIEDQQAISNLDDIIRASDGIMVARGDLGIECPFEDLPVIQHRAVKTCILQGKPVIVATHLLESMIENPIPTRAEVSDVSQAVLELADGVMLSGETTAGKYPLQCVQTLKRIARRMELNHQAEPTPDLKLVSPKGKMLRSSAILAGELEDAGILVFTRSGYLAQMLSSLRPRSPIYAFTDVPSLFRHMLLLWGVEPFLMGFSEDPEVTIHNALEYLKLRRWVVLGDPLVVITNVLAGQKIIDTIQIRHVE